MAFRTREELESFIASLAVPEDRRLVVAAELRDHLESARADALSGGCSPEEALTAGLAFLGEPAVLRARLESVEPAFRFGFPDAVRCGLLTAVAMFAAMLLVLRLPLSALPETAATIARGLAVLAVAVVFTPSGVPALFRAELRAPAVRRRLRALSSTPVGPAMTYLALVTYAPSLLAIVWVVAFGRRAVANLDVLAVSLAATYLIAIVEGIRARRDRRERRAVAE